MEGEFCRRPKLKTFGPLQSCARWAKDPGWYREAECPCHGLRGLPRGHTTLEATVRRAYTSSSRTSSPFVFTRFQHVTSRQQFVPIFLASWLATGLFEFKEREMGVASVL
jgi:hypothetical protein